MGRLRRSCGGWIAIGGRYHNDLRDLRDLRDPRPQREPERASPPPMGKTPRNDEGIASTAVPPPRPSKTRLKRQMHELQQLGRRLADLPPSQLQRIGLPESLREQIELVRRITAREALRRQLQYVGRLMRAADAEAIRARLAAVDRKDRTSGEAG